MAITHGMDAAAVEKVGHALQQTYAAQLRDVTTELEVLVTGTAQLWFGPDADRFRSWWPEKRQRILSMADDLHGFGQSALNNASEQYRASGVDNAAQSSGGVPAAGPPRDPAAVAKWWRELTEQQQQSLLRQDPQRYGSLDGVPLDDRYQANRLYIQAILDGQNLSPDRRATLEAILSDTNSQILFVDPSGDGRIAQVYGDLTTADDIAIVVPGISNDLGNFSGSNAWRLREAAKGQDMATIMWLGYDTPSGISNVLKDPALASNARAEEWAPALKSFVSSVQSYGNGEIAVVAHSYGTVLATEAAKIGMSVDRVVLLGSPGVTAASASVFGGAETYVVENQGDYVPLLAQAADHGIDPHGFVRDSDVFGRTDPTSESFGATVLPGNDWGNPANSHSYFEGQALQSMVQVLSSARESPDGMVTQRFVGADGSAVDVSTGTY